MKLHYIPLFFCFLMIFGNSCVPVDTDTTNKLAASVPKIDPNSVQISKPSEKDLYKAFSPLYDSLFRRYEKSIGFNGAVLVAEKGEVIHTGAYGFANLRRKDSLSIESNFQLASVSKIFTATAIMMLYEEGLLHVDDYVCEYLPEFPYDNISIKNLLNHRSGLCRYMALADEHWDHEQPLSNRDVLCLFAEHQPELWFTPGNRFNYINTNYAFLALIVEEVSGQTFDEFMKAKVFDPLGMEYSLAYTELKKQDIHLQTIGYKGRRRPVGHDYIDGVMGDKGIYSNVIDLYKFDQALREGKLVSLAVQKEAFQPGSPELRTHNYGFGYRMKTQYENIVYHFGWWRGFISCFIRDLETEKTLIILCNKDRLRRSLGFWDVFFLEKILKEREDSLKITRRKIDSIQNKPDSLTSDSLILELPKLTPDTVLTSDTLPTATLDSSSVTNL